MKKFALLITLACLSLLQVKARPSIRSATPNSASRGTKVNVMLQGTSFQRYENARLYNYYGNTIKGTSVKVYNSDSLSFSLTISSTADTGDYVIITNDSLYGDDSFYFFHISVTKPLYSLTSISPNHAKQGQSSVLVHIYGKNTAFTKFSGQKAYMKFNSTYNFTGLSIKSDTELTAYISIPSNANVGHYTVNVTGGVGPLSLNYFTVDTLIRTRSLSGKIKTSKGGSLGHSWVYLVHYNAADTTIHATDSTMTDSAGNYSFSNIADSSTYIYVMPDSALYPNEIPTYYDSTYLFSGAHSVSLAFGSTTLDFTTLAGTNTGGTGFVGGSVTYCTGCKKAGSGAPAANVKILLMDANGKPQRYAFTDTKGNFSFGKIALQKYYFYVDMNGVDNSSAPSIDLTSVRPVRTSLAFTLYPSMLELNATTGVAENNAANEGTISIYPNPFSQDLRIDYNLVKASQTRIIIYDATGKIAYQNTEANQPMGHYSVLAANLAAMPSGLYLVQLNINGELIQRKVVKF